MTLDEPVAEGAASATEHHGASLSMWKNVKVEQALVFEAGLAAVREWKAEHGEFTIEELIWTDDALIVSNGPLNR